MARKLRPEERELWKKVADTATSLAPPTKMEMPRALSVPKAEIKRPASVQPDLKAFKIGMKSRSIPPASRAQAAAKPAPVMDAKSFGKLTRGKLRPEGRIDLHGMTMAQAHPALQDFILGSAQLQRRLVLVITGKGKFKPDHGPIPERHGVLRHNVPIWLRQSPLSLVILEVTQAHQRHGGEGALYVYLRRGR
ncbi:Smr/MutS family protein [Planktomarina temperata]|nr:Smr/MutS family protein [Planktomarina temperata]